MTETKEKLAVTVTSIEGVDRRGSDVYWTYLVTIPVTVKNPTFGGHDDPPFVSDGVFLSTTLDDPKPWEFEDDALELFLDELNEQVSRDLNESWF